MRLTLRAEGTYTYPLPPSLVVALEESIAAHMRAYGVKDVVVKAEASDAVAELIVLRAANLGMSVPEFAEAISSLTPEEIRRAMKSA